MSTTSQRGNLHPRTTRRRALIRGLYIGLFATIGATPTVAAPPQRIVSLNVCADQILVDLVPRERIAAVTHLATDSLTSAKPERAEGIPQTRGAAEDVVALTPDLVLVGEYSTPATTDLLRRLGFRVEPVALPQSLAGIRTVIRHMAELVGEPARGEELIATMNRRIAAAAPHAPSAVKPRALVYQINNFVAREGSLVDEAMRIAGLDNAAHGLRFAKGGQIGVEDILVAKPDVLILASGPDAYRTSVGDNLRHPALKDAKSWKAELLLPWPLWLCATHHAAEAIERLATARDAVANSSRSGRE